MGDHEYTVIPAPARGEKTRAAKTPADRFAHALTQALNAMAAQGWEYVRAETLPSEERSGLTGRTTVWMNMLVFRRARQAIAGAATGTAAAPPPTAPGGGPASPIAPPPVPSPDDGSAQPEARPSATA